MSTRELELRDYQESILDKLRSAFIEGHRSVVLVAPTGAGKTEMAMALLGAAAERGNRAAMVLDRIVLCNQTSARLDSYGFDHGVMQAGHWRFRPAERIQVCSAQTLEKRGSMPGMKVLIVDECFPGDTMIDTPDGPRRIDTICDGERIQCATGVGVIKSVFRTTSAKTVVMRLSDGTRIECTPDHPIFTGMGWQPAGSVAIGTKLFRNQDVRALWDSVPAEGVRAGDKQGTQSRERDAILSQAVLREILREEASEPDGLPSDARQSGEHLAEDRPCTSGQGREWEGCDSARVGAVCEAGGRLGVGVRGQDAAATSAGLPAPLQAGLGASAQDAVRRVGRWQSRDQGSAGAGPEEGCAAAQPWVESAEVVERESAQPVFNLRVSEHPSYFANGVLVHNCHNTRKQTIQFIKNNPSVKVVGLTATPFTKGLGKIYTAVVSAISTRELVDQKMLAPLRVFIAKEIDMTGAKKVAGEWSSAEAEERGIKITGDVVTEWAKKTHEVFGGPRKTVVFAAGVKHAADLAQKFCEAGYNFVSLSYKDDDEFKAEAIREFSKPDSGIVGLIATDILTKGFDVPDVMIGVSARPFTKSLSSHIQQMGRVMRACDGKEFALWLCMARGSRVLTNKGLVPIEEVSLSHTIWDGTNFVTHKGAVCNGIKKVITYQGLTATPGHLVHTAQGWRTFGDCAREQIAITQTGFDGQAIWLGEDRFSGRTVAGPKESALDSCALRVRDVWSSVRHFVEQLGGRANAWLSRLQPTCSSLPDVALCASSGNARAMQKPQGRELSALWRARRGVPIRRREGWDTLDHGEHRNSGQPGGYAVGPGRSDRALRTGKYPLADGGTQPIEQARKSGRRSYAQAEAGSPRDSLLGQYAQAPVLVRDDGHGNHREIPQTIGEAEGEVWDILDCGPGNRFTCEGLLVHNCHSGNYLRFNEDWEDIYENGVTELDDGKEKAKKEPTEKEKEAAKCPRCNAFWPGRSDACACCGFVRPQRNNVSERPGELAEYSNGKKLPGRDERQTFFSQLCGVAEERGYKRGWAFHKYVERYGVQPKGLSDAPMEPSHSTRKWVQSRQIAWAKSRKSAGREAVAA